MALFENVSYDCLVWYYWIQCIWWL